MQPNPISLQDIHAFVGLFGKPATPLEVFVELLGIADMHYLELMNGDGSKHPSKR